MAKPLKPGVGKQKAAEAYAKRVLALTVRDETLEFCPDNLPFGERMAVRRETSFGYEAFWGSSDSIIDLDAFRVLWWLAKRANGETRYQFAKSVSEVADAFEDGAFDVKLTDIDAPEEATDNPES